MEHSPGLVLPSCVAWAIISWGPLWLPGNNPGEEIALDMINYISGLWVLHRLSKKKQKKTPNVFYKIILFSYWIWTKLSERFPNYKLS